MWGILAGAAFGAGHLFALEQDVKWAVPQECLFFAEWTPDEIRPSLESTNSFECILAEPEVREFLAIVQRNIQRKQNQPDSDGTPPAAAILTQFLSGRTTVYLEDPGKSLEPETFSLVVRSAMTPASAAQVSQWLKESFGEVREITIQGQSFYQAEPWVLPRKLTWGIYGGSLWIGVGEGALERAFLLRTERPSWYVNARNRLGVPRSVGFFYCQPQRLIERIADPRATRFARSMGLVNVKEFAVQTGLDREGILTRMMIDIDGAAEGVFAAIGKPLTVEDLAVIPADADFAMAARFDAKQCLKALMEAAIVLDPYAEEDRAVESFPENRDLFKLLDCLGDRWFTYTSPNDGFSPWNGGPFVVDVRDSAGTLGAIESLRVRLLREDTRFIVKEFLGQSLYSVRSENRLFWFCPTWTVTKNELVFALGPAPVKSYLVRPRDIPSFATVPLISQLFQKEKGIVALLYCNADSQTALSYNCFYSWVMLQELQESYGASDAGGESFLPFRSMDIPSLWAIKRHQGPLIMFVRKTERGLEVTHRQSMPGIILGRFIFAIGNLYQSFMVHPQVPTPRFQSQNNLKQIALALHNYHDVHMSFPVARGSRGKGLSWRVHILPYLEWSELYRQFHLDEPWDSPHNRTLIEKMPDVFRSPLGKLPPGYTSYLGVGGPRGLFRPGEGTRLADILDGTSNTAMVIEVGPEQAVIWTKPDDFIPDETKPLLGLRLPLEGGTNVAFCDGSVRFLHRQLLEKTLNAIVTRDGGEVVQWEERRSGR